MIYVFELAPILSTNKIVSLLRWLERAKFIGHLKNLEVNKSGFRGASCQLSSFNRQAIWAQSSIFTNNNVLVTHI